MRNGFLYPAVNYLVKGMYFLNLVELFKFIARAILKNCVKSDNERVTNNEFITVSNIAIDLYQIFKFGILLLLWSLEINNEFSKMVVYYLLISNLFTYFYYHVWGSRYSQRVDRDTLNRKFMNSIFAITFYLLCYAYLYQVHYCIMLKWPNNSVDVINSIYLSVSTAFTLTYGGFQPLTQDVRVVFMSELINTFLFFTIILSNSIPNHAGKEPKDELQK